jgi:hypothetical protein
MKASDSLEKSPDLPPELFQNDVDFATGVSAFFFLPVLVAALTAPRSSTPLQERMPGGAKPLCQE